MSARSWEWAIALEVSVGVISESIPFEYDPVKSQQNLAKHGIDFEDAQQLWQDLRRLEITARSTTEPRFMVIGQIQDKYWSAIATYRGSAIRIISVRRSRTEEANLYES